MSVRASALARRLRGGLLAGLGVPLLLLVPGVGAVHAQDLPLKRPAASTVGPDCPPSPAAAAQRLPTRAVDSLLSAGSQAAILGDFQAAEDLLRRAAQLDGTHPVVAYRLARTLDDQGKLDAAAREYCRYLALTPHAADAEEVRTRVRTLVASGSVSLGPPVEAQLSSAVQAFDAGRFADAIDGFTRAISLEPGHADAHYDRGIAHLAAGRLADAAADLEAYLRLAPQAADRARVRTRIEQLRAQSVAAAAGAPKTAAAPPRRSVAAPGSALVQGLVMPGLGQHATGRTALGVGVLAGVGGAVYLALHQNVVLEQRDAVDPFGNRYQYDVRVRERPYQAVGIGTAVALGLGAAIESFLYARHDRSAPSSSAAGSATGTGAQPRLWVAPAGGGLTLAVQLRAALR